MAVAGKILRETRVLVLGATFKFNVRDLRNSRVFVLVLSAEMRSVHSECSAHLRAATFGWLDSRKVHPR